MARTRSRLSGTKRSIANKRRSAESIKSSKKICKSAKKRESNSERLTPQTKESVRNTRESLRTRSRKELQSEASTSSPSMSQRRKSAKSSNSRKRSRGTSPEENKVNADLKPKKINEDKKPSSNSADKKEDLKQKSRREHHQESSETSSDDDCEPVEKRRHVHHHHNHEGGASCSRDVTPPRQDTPPPEDDTPPGERVAYIHVGEGGEADLQAQRRGSENLDIEILEEEILPDIDEREMIHGLDHTGTARDYVDESHRCTRHCPVGCQGHLRPNEIVIYESFRFEGRLQGRKRYKGRIVHNDVSEAHTEGCPHARRQQAAGRDGGAGRNGDDRRSYRREVEQRERRRGREAAVTGVQRALGAMARNPEGGSSRARPLERSSGADRRERGQHNSNNESPEKRRSGPEMPARMEMLLGLPPVSREVQLEHAWNTHDRSLNIFVKEDDECTFHRHPVAQSTDAIRTKTSYSSGIHAWELTWPVRHRGTHAVVGVATSEATLHTVGYQSLIGINHQSWGWDLGRLKSYHDSQNTAGVTYPVAGAQDMSTVPEKFHMVLDMDAGTLGFMADGKYLGVAHQGLRGKTLFPVVSSVWGHCEITMKYLGGMDLAPIPLMYLCRRAVRRAVGSERVDRGDLEKLNMPSIIKKYLE